MAKAQAQQLQQQQQQHNEAQTTLLSSWTSIGRKAGNKKRLETLASLEN